MSVQERFRSGNTERVGPLGLRAQPRRTLLTGVAIMGVMGKTGGVLTEPGACATATTPTEPVCLDGPCDPVSGGDTTDLPVVARPLSVALALDESGVSGPPAFVITVTNRSNEEVTTTFRNGQLFDIIAVDGDGGLVWRWSEGRMFTQAFRDVAIAPCASVVYRAAYPGLSRTDAVFPIRATAVWRAAPEVVSPAIVLSHETPPL